MTKQTKYFWLSLASIFGIILILFFARFPLVVYEWGVVKAKYLSRGRVAGLHLIRLPVVYHRQEHSLSCEIAALKMGLSVFGINPSESDLISQLKFDSTPKSRGVWGNPDTGFVGNIDGRMLRTGYGVYAGPIADVAQNYVKAEIISGGTAADLAHNLAQGRPVVIWGYFGRGNRYSWKTPDGTPVKAVNGEHARTVIGFVGDEENPEYFVVEDPIYGELYWTKDELLKNWGAFNNMGVVLYPPFLDLKLN